MGEFHHTNADTMDKVSQRSLEVVGRTTDTGRNRNQVHPLRSPVPSIRGKANWHHSTRVFGSHVVLDDGRSRKQTPRFQDLLQRLSHAYLTERTNAGYVPVTTNRKSPLVSVATSLSRPLSDTDGCLISQRFALAAVSGRPLQKPRMKSSGVRFLSRSAFRGSDCFTAAVSIRREDPARLAVGRAIAPSLGFRGFASPLAFPARDLQ